MKRLTKWTIGLCLVGLVAIGFYYALRERPILVDIATATRAPMTVTINQEGRTRVREIYTISSPIAGRMSRNSLTVGDPVKAGETVVAQIRPLDPPLIDSRTKAALNAAVAAARSAVMLAEAERARASAALDLAQADYDRAQNLARTKVISKQALDKAIADLALQRAQLLSSEANIEVRQAELDSAKARLLQPGQSNLPGNGNCCVELTAPSDGVVLDILAKSEQAVAAGAQIARIGDPSQLEIVADLLSRDAVRIAPGMPVTIADWGGDIELPATVRRVDPSAFTKVSALGIEEQRVNVVIDLDQAAPQLGNGFRVFVRLATWQGEDVLGVPIAAIFRHEGRWAVFRIDNDVVEIRAIEVGHMNDEAAEILSGLAAGDIVVVHPNDQLEPGRRITLRQTGAAG